MRNNKSDLFSDENPYYNAAYDLPHLSPISWKYTESEFQPNPKPKPQQVSSRPPRNRVFNPPVMEEKNEKFVLVEYITDSRNEAIWLKNFGIHGCVSQQTNLFIKPDLILRYEKAISKLIDKYGLEKIRNLKRSHLSGFSDPKAKKMASLLNFNPEVQILKPTNYLVNTYYMLINCKSLGYVESIFDSCKISLDMDFKAWIIPESSLSLNMDLSDFKSQRYSNYEFLENSKTQHNLSQIIESVNKEASDGIDFMALISSINVETPQKRKENLYLNDLLWNLSLASNLLANESWFISKIYTSFLPKTNELLFLIYTLFEKVFLIKPSTSSLLSEEKYLICQNYNKQVRNVIAPFLRDNLDKLLADPKISLIKDIKCVTSDLIFYVNINETLNKSMMFEQITFLEELFHREDIIERYKSRIVRPENELFGNQAEERKNAHEKVETHSENPNLINVGVRITEADLFTSEETDKLLGIKKKSKPKTGIPAKVGNKKKAPIQQNSSKTSPKINERAKEDLKRCFPKVYKRLYEKKE